jgi:hypothetical protein
MGELFVTPGGRRLTTAERLAFEPQGLARTHDEEIGYRRGFDQGVAALAYALGISNDDLQRLAWKQRVAAFRRGDLLRAPFECSADERSGLLNAIRRGQKRQ